jgi:hypothetical protein
MGILETVAAALENLLSKPSRDRVIAAAVILYLFGSGLWLFETYTDFFGLRRIHSVLDALTQLGQLRGVDSLRVDPAFVRASSNVLNETTSISSRLKHPLDPLGEVILKMVTAAAPWILASLVFRAAAARSGWSNFAVAGLISAAIGGALPMLSNHYLNYLVFPLSFFAVAVLFTVSARKHSVVRTRD